MRKIINNRRYDTASAQLLGAYKSGDPEDPMYLQEALYRKRTGECFLHGQGGASTKYSRLQQHGGWAAGEAIVPLSYAQAKAWAQEHLGPEAYQAAFEAEISDAIRVHIYLSPDKYAKCKKAAAQQGVSISKYIASLL